MTTVDKEALGLAYDEVRDDQSETEWMVMKYEEKHVVVAARGSGYDEFLQHFDEDTRAYGYLRVVSGDEMSKRSKFVFITWCGPSVGALKRAKVGVDKSLVKNVIKNFAVEISADERSELEYERILETTRKAGGANYGTGN